MAQLRQESGAKLLIHEADRAPVETGDYERTAGYLYGESFPPIRVDGLLHDGDVLSINGLELRVYHTPGHTPGSVCLWTEAADEAGHKTRVLIAGDTLWGGYSPRVGSDLDTWVRSLDRLLQLDFDVITFGHWCAPILDAKQKVAKAREQFCALFNPWFRLNEWH
jgi:glyoxylase-like metal-dependent hydrolase (beta-lactamase superfamily II)